ncbi:MAG TPA: response regulator transcription factor [Longimicrobiaceae bacterium]|nr:response regulator transcription factor [Longimicrobiaceae bacterium]
MPSEIRVLLADDHAMLRAGLKALLSLEPDIDVVGEVGTGEEAVERVRALSPDVVVMDLAMPGIGGLEATRQIAALGEKTRVLVLTSDDEQDSLMPVLDAGGSGFVQKTHAEQDLISAIRIVARDEVFLYPNATKLLLRGLRSAEEKGRKDPLEKLSEREREVLRLSAEGYGSGEIAKKLFLSPKTVDTYRYRLMQKLGMTHRAELVRLALETGLLKPP